MADLAVLNINNAAIQNDSADSSPSNEERPSSAPGRMDGQDPLPLARDVDVRLDPEYHKFYDAYQGEGKLPPPLEDSLLSELHGKPIQQNASAQFIPINPAPIPVQPQPGELEPPSPDSFSSMSFSIGQRLAMNCLDSPHLSPMSGMVSSPQLMPAPAPSPPVGAPSRQRGGVPLGGIPNADTWMTAGWDSSTAVTPAAPPSQQPVFANQVLQSAQLQQLSGDVVINHGGMPYHMVPHQQWVQMMAGQQNMPPQQEAGKHQVMSSPAPRTNRGNNRKGNGRGQRRGRGGQRWQNDYAHHGSPEQANVAPYNSINDVVGKMYSLSRDQLGCRFLQKCLDDGAEVADMIFKEIENHFIELMTDPFGNYLCQKLMEVCTPALRSKIVDLLASSLADICFDSHGTRAVQRLIAILANNNMQQSEQEVVVSALKQNLILLVRNLNGNHVVQACLHHLSSNTNTFIFDIVTANCVHVATHRHGCCVMQRCIDYGNLEQREALIAEIVNKTLLLVQDPFGNYVIQYILDLRTEWILRDVFVLLSGQFVKLSMGKFSSNVVEKCLVLLPEDAIRTILNELSHPECIAMLLKDSYANYVIQKAVMLENSAVLDLVLSIKPHLKTLKDTAYGKKLTTKLQKKFGSVIFDT